MPIPNPPSMNDVMASPELLASLHEHNSKKELEPGQIPFLLAVREYKLAAANPAVSVQQLSEMASKVDNLFNDPASRVVVNYAASQLIPTRAAVQNLRGMAAGQVAPAPRAELAGIFDDAEKAGQSLVRTNGLVRWKQTDAFAPAMARANQALQNGQAAQNPFNWEQDVMAAVAKDAAEKAQIAQMIQTVQGLEQNYRNLSENPTRGVERQKAGIIAQLERVGQSGIVSAKEWAGNAVESCKQLDANLKVAEIEKNFYRLTNKPTAGDKFSAAFTWGGIKKLQDDCIDQIEKLNPNKAQLMRLDLEGSRLAMGKRTPAVLKRMEEIVVEVEEVDKLKMAALKKKDPSAAQKLQRGKQQMLEKLGSEIQNVEGRINENAASRSPVIERSDDRKHRRTLPLVTTRSPVLERSDDRVKAEMLQDIGFEPAQGDSLYEAAQANNAAAGLEQLNQQKTRLAQQKEELQKSYTVGEKLGLKTATPDASRVARKAQAAAAAAQDAPAPAQDAPDPAQTQRALESERRQIDEIQISEGQDGVEPEPPGLEEGWENDEPPAMAQSEVAPEVPQQAEAVRRPSVGQSIGRETVGSEQASSTNLGQKPQGPEVKATARVR